MTAAISRSTHAPGVRSPAAAWWAASFALHTPRTYVTEGLAPADARPDVYLVLALLAAGSALALLVLGGAGIISFAIRYRGAPRP